MNVTDVVKYDSAFGEVTLTMGDVTKYLARGSTELTEREIVMFINLCKYQGLNPFVGEAYAVKFGSDFQMIVGYDTYKRRAEEHPEYRGRKSGIVVLRNDTVGKREGACLYPGEVLIGGWCTVYRARGDRMEETYSEVSMTEYTKYNKEGKPQSNWATKPATMIRKVAVSQALRDAFPTQFTGLYSEYDMPNGQDGADPGTVAHENVIDGEEPVTKEDRQALFAAAKEIFGDKGNDVIKELLHELGLESTQQLKKHTYRRVLKRLQERAEGIQPMPEDELDRSFDQVSGSDPE